MRLREGSRVEAKPLVMEPGRFGVFMAHPPFNTWLNVPCSFATIEAAQRVADVIREEAFAPSEAERDGGQA